MNAYRSLGCTRKLKAQLSLGCWLRYLHLAQKAKSPCRFLIKLKHLLLLAFLYLFCRILLHRHFGQIRVLIRVQQSFLFILASYYSSKKSWNILRRIWNFGKDLGLGRLLLRSSLKLKLQIAFDERTFSWKSKFLVSSCSLCYLPRSAELLFFIFQTTRWSTLVLFVYHRSTCSKLLSLHTWNYITALSADYSNNRKSSKDRVWYLLLWVKGPVLRIFLFAPYTLEQCKYSCSPIQRRLFYQGIP